jgi:hypothetical protein
MTETPHINIDIFVFVSVVHVLDAARHMHSLSYAFTGVAFGQGTLNWQFQANSHMIWMYSLNALLNNNVGGKIDFLWLSTGCILTPLSPPPPGFFRKSRAAQSITQVLSHADRHSRGSFSRKIKFSIQSEPLDCLDA